MIKRKLAAPLAAAVILLSGPQAFSITGNPAVNSSGKNAPEVIVASALVKVTTVVTAVDSNQAQDGYIVKTKHGVFEMAYGAGGYGKFGDIYDLILKSLEQKIPVTIVNGPDGIEDVLPAK